MTPNDLLSKSADKPLSPEQRSQLNIIIGQLAKGIKVVEIARINGCTPQNIYARLKRVNLTVDDIQALPDLVNSKSARLEILSDKIATRLSDQTVIDDMTAKDLLTGLKTVESLITPQPLNATIRVSFDIRKLDYPVDVLDITPQ